MLKDLLPDKIAEVDRRAYGRYVANWTYLSSYLASGDAGKHALGIMLKLELEGKARDFIISRLIGRICTIYREGLIEEINSLIQNKKSVQSDANGA